MLGSASTKMTIPDTMKGPISYQNETIGEKKEYTHLKDQQQQASNISSTSTLNASNYYGKYPYDIIRIVGQGTFGKVYEAKTVDNKRVAIKKVEKSSHFISREYDILKIINHPNCLKILDMFITNEENKKMQNLVFDFIPYTLASLLKKKSLSLNFIRVQFYQLCLAIKHIHSKNICHRDITPNNILLNMKGELVLADFGSAKVLEQNHTSMSYICSRYYRAPELLVGCQNYTTKIDIWSIGCILAEMLIGKPLFPGTNSADQLARIIEVLGTPKPDDMEAMKPSKNHTLQVPSVLPKLYETFANIEEKDVVDLLAKIFIFDPTKRASIDEILAHPFLLNVNLNSLDQFDEMKCFTKQLTTSSTNLLNSSTSSSTTTNTSTNTNNKDHSLSRMNSSVVTSSTNLISLNTSTNATNPNGGNASNKTTGSGVSSSTSNNTNTNHMTSLSNSNSSVINSQPPLTINTT